MPKSRICRVVLSMFLLALTVAPLPGSATTNPSPHCARGGVPAIKKPAPQKPASIFGPIEVRIPPGGRRTVPYTVAIPQPPRKADILFLMDTTTSMDDPICGLQRALVGIARGLAEAGVDAWFGLAETRDYPIVPYGECNSGQEADYAYQLDSQMGPLSDSLVHAVNALHTSGGGNVPEGQLPALYQAATGAGQAFDQPVIVPTPGAPRYCDPSIPAGQGAAFRDNTLKIIVTISDEPYNDSAQPEHDVTANDPPYPGPSFDATIQALNNAQVHQVGIYVDDNAYFDKTNPDTNAPGNAGTTSFDMRRMAASTGAVAGGGVDCNGDGRPDLNAGDALVCTVVFRHHKTSSIGLTPSIIAVITSIPDPTPLQLSARGHAGLVAGVAPSSVTVNLVDPHPAHFQVTYKCPGLEGSILPVDLAASIPGDVVAKTSTKVICTIEPAPDVVPPIPSAVHGPPPQHNFAPQSHTQLQSQAHSASQLNPAILPEQQTELQLEGQSAMSRRRLPSPMSGVAVAFVAGCAALAFARTRVQTEPIRRKR